MTTPAAAAAVTMNWLTTSDVASALVGAGFGEVYGTMGSTQMLAVRSLAVSILARMMSQSTTLTTAIPSLDADQKNQLIVGVLNGAISYYKKQSLLKAVFTGISIDLIGSEVLKLLKFDDKSLIGGSTV